MTLPKGDSVRVKEQPFSSVLPQVTEEEAAILRELISQRIFKPPSTRPTEEVFPNPEYIVVFDKNDACCYLIQHDCQIDAL
jgi:hypothetical protein